ncbi:MAG: hypothetical protein AAGJ55_08200 [Cyanobacteria bacterium J06555_12]
MNLGLRLAVPLAAMFLLGACASQSASNAVNLMNQELIQSGSPYRWQTEQVSGGTAMTKLLIGTPGNTAADEVLQRDIISQLAAVDASGVASSDRPKEIRIISRTDVAAEEVWVFDGGEKDLVFVIILHSSDAGGTDIKGTGPW